MKFDTRSHRITVDGAHLLVVTLIVAYCGWYFLNARAASASVDNLMLIEPVALFTFIAYFFIAKETVRVERKSDSGEGAETFERPSLSHRERVRIFGSMGLLAAYVATMTSIGYDIATFIYIAASLAFLGERRIFVLIGAPLVFCLVSIYLFNNILQTQIPLFFGAHQ